MAAGVRRISAIIYAMPNYQAILFDLDGTLVETISLYKKAVIGSFAKHGMQIDDELFTAFYVMHKHMKEMLEYFEKTEADVPVLRKERDDLYVELLSKEAEWLPNAREAMMLAKSKAPIAIVTGSWKRYVEALDKKMNLKEFTDIWITADDIHEFMKPDPKGLMLAAEALKVDPKQCIYIGDQAFDMEAAKRAQMTACLIGGEYTPKEAFDLADITVKSLNELAAIL